MVADYIGSLQGEKKTVWSTHLEYLLWLFSNGSGGGLIFPDTPLIIREKYATIYFMPCTSAAALRWRKKITT